MICCNIVADHIEFKFTLTLQVIQLKLFDRYVSLCLFTSGTLYEQIFKCNKFLYDQFDY